MLRYFLVTISFLFAIIFEYKSGGCLAHIVSRMKFFQRHIFCHFSPQITRESKITYPVKRTDTFLFSWLSWQTLAWSSSKLVPGSSKPPARLWHLNPDRRKVRWGGTGGMCVGGIRGSHRHAGPLHGSSSLGSWWGVMAVHFSSQTAPLQWKQLLESPRCRRVSHALYEATTGCHNQTHWFRKLVITGTRPVGFSNSNLSVLLFRFSGICYCL